mmetsp:Transcript_11689/g.21168  ORF Transcript_11689/g.21168 Transcript_11689/m.21168 type:complete len:1806 (-) Transcript_11689:90-5507(-)
MGKGEDFAVFTENRHIQKLVAKYVDLCKPKQVVFCNGSKEEYSELCEKLVDAGTLIRLNEKLRPNSFLARSDPSDCEHIESRTFICSTYQEDAGPTNFWADPDEMMETLTDLYRNCMTGRTLYVIPFCMGPIDSEFSKCGVALTDSEYVVLNMHIMNRVGDAVLKKIGRSASFVPCIHSVGYPLFDETHAPHCPKDDVPWPCNDTKYICHFPETPSVMSFGSLFAGNSLLSKKCFALRIASAMGHDHDWMAEHCLILGVRDSEGNKRYFAAAFPSAAGKTNLAMMVSSVPGYTISCVGDDIAWMRIGKDGRLWALNPEKGFFGVAPGTSKFSNPAAMQTLERDTLFTNVALTPEGDVWWEGMKDPPASGLIDWTGQEWTPDCGRKAAHPNARYTAPAKNCPVLDDSWEDPEGVPISGILFGGRRATTVPLVTQSFSWKHGCFMGSMLSSELAAAPEGTVGALRIDSFAMKPFVGYNMGDYFQHWIRMGEKLDDKAPKIFYVNWFRQGSQGNFLWPGFGENTRVLKWIVGRITGGAKGSYTPVGIVPTETALDLHGLSIPQENLKALLTVNPREWLNELPQIRSYQKQFLDHFPEALRHELTEFELRLHFAVDDAPTTNAKLVKWVNESRELCKPEHVYWCDGSAEEYALMCDCLVESGTFVRLNEKKRPNSFLARSDPSDTARVEASTLICCPKEEDAGPTNNWAEPEAMKRKLRGLFDASMRGRVMYVIPFCMGPLGSKFSRFGVQITDSPYVVVNMHIMTRMGYRVLHAMGSQPFLKCMHSVGKPLAPGEKDVPWPCNAVDKYICHFPQDPQVISFGSGYGGNALLGKKCFALRIASTMGQNEGWMAEHMLILSITNPKGEKKFISAAFPSACGKTNLALLTPTLPGWKVQCVGDDIAWMRIGDDGRLFAVNPEAGFFGVAPGTSDYTNRAAMETLRKDCIFTNVGLTPDGDVWWEGMTSEPPPELEDWTYQHWTPDCGRKAAHPNARYTCPAKNCPNIDPDWENPNGVPISAMIFGGRRGKTVPLVTESFDWNHGVFMGSMCASEQTAAAEGKVGALRFDPMAMKPFIGYHCGDYMQHWLDMGERLGSKAPKIFYVNWFRKDAEGKFIWPGFGENCRVLKWITERVANPNVGAKYSPIGLLPTQNALDVRGLRLSEEDLVELIYVNPSQWIEELEHVRAFHATLGDHWPPRLHHELTTLEQRLHYAATAAVPTSNEKVIDWVQDMVDMCVPDHVHWCDGTEEEYALMCDLLVESKTFVRLNPALRPNSFLARTDPSDVARVESRTFICSKKEEDAGPTNNWRDPGEMKTELKALFSGCMKGRTMYVIPFCMGPLGSPYSRYGIQVTDSPYVVANMRIMTRMGFKVLKAMGAESFVPCLHSVGKPLSPGETDVPWPCNSTKYIVQFPDDPQIMSFGSGYGGNALMGKKCFALRIATVMGRNEGWMAEHMLILSITNPAGKEFHVAAAFPSACGKTNLAMLVPTIPGFTVKCVGDDIAWMHVGKDGRLWAINPESGFFGVAPGTSNFTNHSAMETVKRDSIFTNVALTPNGDVWWEGMTSEPPPVLEDWTYQHWTPDCGRKAAHPNARYTCYAKNCPVIDPNWENPNGVPIDAIIFGGRRSSTIPLVNESLSWEHGVFLGSVCSSEQTAAAEGKVGALRFDPMALRPFTGYNMGDYFQHWLDMGRVLKDKAPKIFYVNWFRKNSNGKFIWPGFGENSRVLKWICERVDGVASAVETEIGNLPALDSIDVGGLDVTTEQIQTLLKVDKDAWKHDIAAYDEHYAQFGDKLPVELSKILQDLKSKLK